MLLTFEKSVTLICFLLLKDMELTWLIFDAMLIFKVVTI